MTKNNLDFFGEMLMTRVRDEAIDDWERIMDGKMSDEESVKIYHTLSDREKELMKRLVPKIVDTTLHHLLWTLELETHPLHMSYKNEKRRVRVLLPKNYDKDEAENYPVVYMHDGQNVFYCSEAYSGYSWKVIQAIKLNPDLPKMIVVGIDNAEQDRIDEYTPWKITESPLLEDIELGGRGVEFAEFVMTVVKPFIDQHYRTKSDKYHTAMIGSSLGGNITAFMGIKYKDQIGGLGIFSLANWITSKAFDSYIAREALDPEQRVYIQVGTQEGDDADRQLMYGNMKQAYIDCSLKYYKQLIKGSVPIDSIRLNIFADEEHDEKAWAKHLPECLRFLSEKWS